MAKELMKRIDTLNGDFFPYILGQFYNPPVHVIGTMDLNDPAARDGGESNVVFYFMITPEEYSWYDSDRSKLNDLAQRLQISMPASRFLAAIPREEQDPDELKALIKHSISDTPMANDAAYEVWAAELRAETARKNAAAREAREKASQIPPSPLNDARHELYVHQQSIRARDKVIADFRKAMQGKDPQSEEFISGQEWLKNAMEQRRTEAAKGQPLEDALGNHIFTSSVIYVAADTCWRPGLPLANAATGTVCIFSTREIADRYQALFQKNKKLFPTIMEVPRNHIKDFLRACEMLGLGTFLLDDGVEPVSILLKNIIPRLNRGYIENRNAGIRGLIVRCLQVQAAITRHGDEMEEEWRLSQVDHRATLDRAIMQELGGTVLFVPAGIPAKAARPFAGNYVYTVDANARIHALCAKDKIAQPQLNRNGFTGQHIILPADASFPCRVMNLKKEEGEQHLLMAFTSREEAMAFTANQKEMQSDTIIAVTMDELLKFSAGLDGVNLDAPTLGMILTHDYLEKALEIRGGQKIIYNHNYKKPE